MSNGVAPAMTYTKWHDGAGGARMISDAGWSATPAAVQALVQEQARADRAVGGAPGCPRGQVDHSVEVTSPLCGQCSTPLEGDDPSPARHQVAELPRVAPEVTENRR